VVVEIAITAAVTRVASRVVDRVFDLLENKKISKYRFAKDIGATDAHVHNWSNGAIPSTEYIIKIASYLGVSTDYLLGVDDDLGSLFGIPEFELKMNYWSRGLSVFTSADFSLRLSRLAAYYKIPSSSMVSDILKSREWKNTGHDLKIQLEIIANYFGMSLSEFFHIESFRENYLDTFFLDIPPAKPPTLHTADRIKIIKNRINATRNYSRAPVRTWDETIDDLPSTLKSNLLENGGKSYREILILSGLTELQIERSHDQLYNSKVIEIMAFAKKFNVSIDYLVGLEKLPEAPSVPKEIATMWNSYNDTQKAMVRKYMEKMNDLKAMDENLDKNRRKNAQP